MAQSKNPQPDVTENNKSLKTFLNSFSSLPDAIEKGMLKFTSDEDEKAVVSAFAAPLKEQITKLCSFLDQESTKISRQAQKAVSEMLELSGATVLTAQGHALAGNLASNSSRLGLSGIVDMIKKIIQALPGIFGFSFPKWLIPLLELIDEILHWVLSGGIASLRITLSKLHQNYMAELVQLARLQRESQWQFATNGGAEEQEG